MAESTARTFQIVGPATPGSGVVFSGDGRQTGTDGLIPVALIPTVLDPTVFIPAIVLGDFSVDPV